MDAFELTKPLGVLKKTVVLEVLNDYECNYANIFMRVETEKAQVHPVAIQAAEEMLRRASPEERERLQREIDVYSLASDFKLPVGPQAPVLGAIWILGARR